MGEWWDWQLRYPRMSPLPVREGIKAGKRGRVGGESWWADRWIRVLESFGWEWPNRLHRGRSYARRGQVITFEITHGQITANVQGSRPTPYQVEIRVRQLSPREWHRVADALTEQAVFAAKLLAGEMPPEIEQAFANTGVSLFPASAGELEMRCSCPDWVVPCKHIAAVYYIVGEAFDRNPFLMFHLRGRSREGLLSDLRKKRGRGTTRPGKAARVPRRPARARAPTTVPLATRPEEFWQGDRDLEGFRVSVVQPALKAPLLRRLGVMPFWTETEEFFSFMDRIYEGASRHAMDHAYRAADKGLQGRDGGSQRYTGSIVSTGAKSSVNRGTSSMGTGRS